MKKNTAIILFLGIFFMSCKKETKNKEENIIKEKTFKSANYTYNDGTSSVDVIVSTPPQKAALFSHFMTEMLLALGLEDRIVLGTTEGEILPKFKEAYNKIPNKIKGHHSLISKEAFLLMEPDFVSGWEGTVKQEVTGSAEELVKKEIYPFSVKSIRSSASLNTVYEDFHLLGKIFGVEEKAEKIVTDMKEKLAKAKTTFKEISEVEKRKVLIFSSIENGIFVAGVLASDLIKKANGKNVYDDLKNDHELVSYESIVDRNPEIIFITEMASGMTVVEKIDFLKKHPALKNLPAVKNNNIHKIDLADVAPGVRNVDLIIKMNTLFYK